MVPVMGDTIKRTSYVRMPHIGNVSRLSTNIEISTRAETDSNTHTEHNEHSGDTEHSSATNGKKYPLMSVAMYGVAGSDALNQKTDNEVSKSGIKHDSEISTITAAAN